MQFTLELAAGVVLLVGLFGALVIYNGLVNLRNECDRAWGNIDVLLRQRGDELPNLVRVCEAHMAHERKTLTQVTAARQAGLDARTPVEIEQAARLATLAIGALYARVENYPTLRANQSLLELQRRITGIENEIADRREYFNHCVTNYNNRIQQLPDALLAGWLRLRPKTLLRRTGIGQSRTDKAA